MSVKVSRQPLQDDGDQKQATLDQAQEQRSLPQWHFTTLDCGGDFITDPALTQIEADAILERCGSFQN